MCGIAGILAQSNYIKRDTLEAMGRAMMHRGPDDAGIELISVSSNKDLSLGLVHQRLSIIDLTSSGHQPMSNEDNTVWIVFNGEIYNYREIRSTLEAKGHRFRSQSDTEVIIHAYEEWGLECLHELRGMFAFAIYDQKKKILFLSVDRFGIKPLYYYRGRDNLFIFASEVRTIINSKLFDKQLDPIAVDSYLAYGAIQAPLTIVKGAYSLLPAHYLIYNFEKNSVQTFQYWKPSYSTSDKQDIHGTGSIDKLKFILEDSIKQHLVSDVPVGIFLSGGIDSSTIVALANKISKGSLQSFSVTFPESGFSEEKYSRLIVKRFCKSHTEIRISQDDLLDLLPGALEAMDQPTIDGINVYAISKVVRQTGIKTVLSGQGGDEIFGGYPTFKRIPLILRMHELIKYFPTNLRKNMGSTIDILFNRSKVKSKLSLILESDGNWLSLYLILRQLFNQNSRDKLLKIKIHEDTINGVSLEAVESITKNTEYLDMFSKISLAELRLYLANMLLRDSDFMSMAHGLEVRVPFLDHKLVEFVFSVPARMKLQSNLTKPLLVNSFKDLLPKEIYLRPKMGFTFPWSIWLKKRLRYQVEEVIYGFPKNNDIGLDINECQSLWQSFISNTPGVNWVRVWSLYVLLKWYNKNFSQ